MFCHIIENLRGRSLVSHEVVVHPNSAPTTKAGRAARSELDEGCYPIGRQVSGEQMDTLSITRDPFHGESIHTTSPRYP